MSIIQRKGLEAVEHIERGIYFDQRRKAVDNGWAIYRGEVIEREERNESQPFRFGFEELHKQTDAFVKREAQRWAKRCRNYRLYEDDFESEFRFVVARAALSYTGERGSFFDYLRVALRNAARDMIRSTLSKKNRINHLALSLEDDKVRQRVDELYSVNPEDQAIARVIVSEMAADRTLTDVERALFEYLRKYPDATLQEMADAIGVKDRKQASRVKERLASKLYKYIAD